MGARHANPILQVHSSPANWIDSTHPCDAFRGLLPARCSATYRLSRFSRCALGISIEPFLRTTLDCLDRRSVSPAMQLTLVCFWPWLTETNQLQATSTLYLSLHMHFRHSPSRYSLRELSTQSCATDFCRPLHFRTMFAPCRYPTRVQRRTVN